MRIEKNLRALVLLGVLVALQTILGSLLTVQFLITKITFSFIITAIIARRFNPVTTAAACAVSNVLGMILFPKYEFFIGFVITAALTGIIFSLFFYQQKITLFKIITASLIVSVFCNLGLNSLWLHIMYGTSWAALLSVRVPQEIITVVLYVVVIAAVFRVKVVDRLMTSI